MPATERRMTPRFNLRTPLSFQRMEAAFDMAQKAKAINISASGVYFATNLAIVVGEFIEVLIEIPRRVTGIAAISRRFTGRVAHIESAGLPQGLSMVGVLFLYYEIPQPARRISSCKTTIAAGSVQTDPSG